MKLKTKPHEKKIGLTELEVAKVKSAKSFEDNFAVEITQAN
jgi:hypothetical protein